MRRWIFGLIAFFFTLGICVWAVSLFPVKSPSQVETSHIEEAVSPLTSPSPEFSKLAVDEDVKDPDLVFSIVYRGESAVCRSEKGAFSKGKALVLSNRGGVTSLEKTRLNFRPLVQTETSAFFPVKFKSSDEALFLFSDNGVLKPGPVQTLYAQPWTADVPDDENFSDKLRIGDQRTFGLGDKNYAIRVSTGPAFQSTPVAVLVLENINQKQIIWYGEVHDDNFEVCELKWVGDLDGDNKLDIMFMYYEVNGGGSVDALLLSSLAKPGNLVGPAAFVFARDCH